MEKQSLTDKAKAQKPERTPYKITQEVIDLALAWKNDEVSIGQIQKALNIKEPNKIYAILARALKASAKPPIEKVKINPGETTKFPYQKFEKKPTKTLGKTPDEAPSKY